MHDADSVQELARFPRLDPWSAIVLTSLSLATVAVAVAMAPDRWRHLLVDFCIAFGLGGVAGSLIELRLARKLLRRVEIVPPSYVVVEPEWRLAPEIAFAVYLGVALVGVVLYHDWVPGVLTEVAGVVAGIHVLPGLLRRRMLARWERLHGRLLVPARLPSSGSRPGGVYVE
jgi:hypothetical protein